MQPPLLRTNQCRRLLSLRRTGSDHSSDDDSSPCLSELLLDFIEDRTLSPEDSADAEAAVVAADFKEAVGKIRRIVAANGNVESYKKLLMKHVLEAVEIMAGFQMNDVVLRRRLSEYLREVNHNAAVCKTKWERSPDVAAGNHEFIDVVRGHIRYFIDTNFSAQFEIARPTVQYTELLKSLPRVFVGTAVDLKRIVRIMCDAADRSLSSRELSVPPWRKNIYMQKKWLGPYRRTENPVPDGMLSPENSSGVFVKCRFVGFDAVVSSVEIDGRVFGR